MVIYRFHFRYRHLKVLTEVAFLTRRGREFQMAAPEYMNDLRKSSQLGFDIYSWLQLVDLVLQNREFITLYLLNFSGRFYSPG